jgi:hypothetical protein
MEHEFLEKLPYSDLLAIAQEAYRGATEHAVVNGEITKDSIVLQEALGLCDSALVYLAIIDRRGEATPVSKKLEAEIRQALEFIKID